MDNSLKLLLAFLSVLCTSVGVSAIREASDEEFPFQVAVQTQDKRHLCGGAIITPTWVLTAKECLERYFDSLGMGQTSVKVAYGRVDSNNPLAVAESENIVLQKEFLLHRRNALALIQLKRPIEFSKTVQPAGLPTSEAELRNTTKLSGWRVTHGINLPPNLYVSDVYHVVPKDCATTSGTPVNLQEDEFCGFDEDQSSAVLGNPGTTVSKRAVVLGLLPKAPLGGFQPAIFVKLSEHESWIRSVLASDAKDVNWVDKVPKDSAPSDCAVSFVLLGISAVFVRFI